MDILDLTVQTIHTWQWAITVRVAMTVGIGGVSRPFRDNTLSGKAFWIYWPHGVPFLNDGRGIGIVAHKNSAGEKVDDYPRYSVPFYPDIPRMKRIR